MKFTNQYIYLLYQNRQASTQDAEDFLNLLRSLYLAEGHTGYLLLQG